MSYLKTVAVSAAASSRAGRGARASALLLLCGACSSDRVNLGEDLDDGSSPGESVCAPAAGSSLLVESQAQLDALEGCSVISGDLHIAPFFGADLRPLRALARVEGTLALGYQPPIPPGLSDEEAGDYLLENGYHEYHSDWLTSLAGLERLEAVDSLVLVADVADLLPLQRLRYVPRRIELASMNLPDLAGLEGVRGAEELIVDGCVADLSALRLPVQMSRLRLSQCVERLDASQLEAVGELELGRTQLTNLDAFAALRVVEGQLRVAYNHWLENMDGLAGLTSFGELHVASNDVLTRLPQFTSLRTTGDVFHVSSNPLLSEFVSFPASVTIVERDENSGSRSFVDMRSIEIVNNPSLSRVRLPDAWHEVDSLLISSNALLQEVDLSRLLEANELTIESNAQLARVTVRYLHKVTALSLLDNPLLSPSDFAGVRTVLSQQMSGNAAP